MESSKILRKIELAFPFIEMPAKDEMAFHESGCRDCDETSLELEHFRGVNFAIKDAKMLHRSLYMLSPQATQWILPYYLRYCLEPNGEYNHKEIESLIYALSPKIEFQPETFKRLSLLNKDQIDVLILFLRWCLDDEYWSEYCPDNIGEAISFMQKLNQA